MLFPLPEAIVFFAWAFLSAALEVNIEGPHGWATSLPTWRRARGGRIFRAAQLLLMGGRPMTGYHHCMFSLQFLALHLCYAQGTPLTWMNECQTLALFFLVCPTWDFLWFVLNPAYGSKKFSKEHIEWHAGRWWPFNLFPVDYAVSAFLSLVFMVIAIGAYEEPLNLIGLMGFYFLWALLIALTADLIGPWYRDRRVRLLAGNVPSIVEVNVDSDRADSSNEG